jgi:proteasome accessory factor C
MATKKGKRGPEGAAERVARLLVLVPWLLERGQAEIAQVAKEFKISEKQVVADLELASVCGAPPFTAFELIDVYVDDDKVMAYAGIPTVIRRPLKMNTAELFALTTMGAAAMAVPGADKHGPLNRALAKLRPLMPSDATPIVVDLPKTAYVEEVREAAIDGERLEIQYFTPASGARTTRVITPRNVFERGGHWYVSADDDRSGERREFRLDRIEKLTHTGMHDAREEDDESSERPREGEEWFTRAGTEVTLKVAPKSRYLVESYPYLERKEHRDGSLTVKLGVSSEHWLGRLLIRGGTDIEVVGGTAPADVRARTARQVLARYSQ